MLDVQVRLTHSSISFHTSLTSYPPPSSTIAFLCAFLPAVLRPFHSIVISIVLSSLVSTADFTSTLQYHLRTAYYIPSK